MTEGPTTSERMNANTVDAVQVFLEAKINKHEISTGVGNPLVTGVKKFIEVEDQVATTSLESLDVDQLIERFRIKNSADLTDSSVQAYISRFRRALTMYTNWRNGDPWNVGGRHPRAQSTKRNGSSTRKSTTREPDGGKPAVEAPAAEGRTTRAVDHVQAPSPDDDLFDYRVECDNGKVAVLKLPRRYNKTDATRMKAIIDALARDEQPAATESSA